MAKENKIFVVVSAIFFLMFFLFLLSGIIFGQQISDKNGNNDANPIAWEELYPYDTVIPAINSSEQLQENDRSPFYNFTRFVERFGRVGNSLAKLNYRYREISQIGYVIASRLTDPSVGDTYIKLKNGYWVASSSSKLLLSDAKSKIYNYYLLQHYLKEEGIGFFYCFAPAKECALDVELPNGVFSYENQNIDTYINVLDAYGINYIDFRERLHDDGLDHYSMFYKTDHHWNVDAGIWAASTIEKEINDRFGIYIRNVYDWGSYTRTTYPKAMFGSYGQAVTHFNEDSEDFDILFPDFKTNFELEIPDKSIDATGSFQEIFIDYDELNSEIEKGGGYVYEAILYGNRPYVKITNLGSTDGPKVLMIRDSFSLAAAPYLALSCSELVLLDTRSSNGNFTGSIVNCIDSFQPDIVLALQSGPQMINLNK